MESLSKTARLMKSGGFYINNVQVAPNTIPTLTAENFLGGKLCILCKGKKSYATVRAAGA